MIEKTAKIALGGCALLVVVLIIESNLSKKESNQYQQTHYQNIETAIQEQTQQTLRLENERRDAEAKEKEAEIERLDKIRRQKMYDEANERRERNRLFEEQNKIIENYSKQLQDTARRYGY
jgi:hypothetical protein